MADLSDGELNDYIGSRLSMLGEVSPGMYPADLVGRREEDADER